ncbi:MAG TPA: pyridoxamine 5'-phosphate oxidase [Gemmatimonadales bacterium]|mgnify:FL=1|nr:pyridoxamine 5'-phosphate oxidase [Gemmatimonadales bacterium]
MNLADLRRDYAKADLDIADTDPDPIVQFRRWFTEAEQAEILEPNAMTLATATADGRPSARIVLLKGLSEAGFVFFTDYRSRKARELEANPHAALAFHWGELERQVRVVGRVERIPASESMAYFLSRPVGSQVGAWASLQSALLEDRSLLMDRVGELVKHFTTTPISWPTHWGGYRIAPDEVEFWQGRPNRLHDRIHYTLHPESGWQRVRLSP